LIKVLEDRDYLEKEKEEKRNILHSFLNNAES
jgi:hypothetical protein